MGRTKGAITIRAWRMESLIQDMAVGDRTDADLAEQHGVEVQTVAAFRLRHKDDISAVVQGMVDQGTELVREVLVRTRLKHCLTSVHVAGPRRGPGSSTVWTPTTIWTKSSPPLQTCPS